MAAVQDNSEAYAEYSATPLAIAGQWPRELRGYTEKNGITFPLLVDKTRDVIKSYGVYHWLSLEAYNIARPATFIIDKTGIIRYMYIGTHQFDLVKQAEILESLKEVSALEK